MTLVATNNLVEFLDAATDPFSGNNNANVLINESQRNYSGSIIPKKNDNSQTLKISFKHLRFSETKLNFTSTRFKPQSCW